MPEKLTNTEKAFLLKLAREAVTAAARGSVLPQLDLPALSSTLQAPGASFVTLTIDGELRGCIGALEPYQPLAEDVREHAMAAATQDFRFSPVTLNEVPQLHIEVSRLTHPEPLLYETPDELLIRLRPGVDGVVLKDGPYRRATFLPQVWDKIPDPAMFLSYLCQKMGAASDLWRRKRLDVLIYQVEEFQEE